MLPDDALAKIETILVRRFDVDATWIFGSEATGAAGPESDLDIAVLMDRLPSFDEHADARNELAAAMGREVDLVDLRRASPILAYQVLGHGILVSDRNPKRRIEFVASVPGRREDVLIIRREAEKRLLERICDG